MQDSAILQSGNAVCPGDIGILGEYLCVQVRCYQQAVLRLLMLMKQCRLIYATAQLQKYTFVRCAFRALTGKSVYVVSMTPIEYFSILQT